MNFDGKLAGRTATGAMWLVGSKLATKVIDLATLLILARLLTPLDFGVVAIAMPIVQILEAILEIPIGQVLVTRTRIDDDHLNTAFTLGLLRGLFLAGISALLAFPLAHIYNDYRMFEIVPLLGLAPAVRGLASPQLATYAQRLDYRPNFLIDLSGKLAAFILSCTLAIFQHDYHSLLVGTLASPAVGTIMSYVIAPLRPRLTLRAWSSFAHFLTWTTISQALGALSWQCDRLFLGRFGTKVELGVFSLANDLSYLPEQALVRPIVAPLMSVFVKVKHDKQRLASAYSRSATIVLGLGLPIMITLSVLAQPLVSLALGGKWLAAVSDLQWLSLTLIPPLLFAPLPGLAMALGRPKILFYQAMAETASKVPLVAVGAALLGADGVIIARAISSLAAAAIAIYLVRQLIGTTFRDQMLAIWRIVGAGFVLAYVLLVLRTIVDSGSQLQLICVLPVITLIGLACYCGSLAIFWVLSRRPDGLERMALSTAGQLIEKYIKRT